MSRCYGVVWCVVFGFVVPGAGRAQDAAGKLAGSWTGEVEGLREVWTIKRDAAKWTVIGRYLESDREVGSFHGSNYRLSGETLTFTQVFDKKPRSGWLDGAVYTVKPHGEKLSYRWKVRKVNGTRELVRAAADAKSDPKTTDAPAAKKADAPAAAQPGETVRFVVALIAPVGADTITQLRKGAVTRMRTQASDPRAYESAPHMNLKEVHSLDPKTVTLKPGKYYVSFIQYERDGKSQLTPMLFFFTKPVLDRTLSKVTFLGEAKSTFDVGPLGHKEQPLYIFEATVGK